MVKSTEELLYASLITCFLISGTILFPIKILGLSEIDWWVVVLPIWIFSLVITMCFILITIEGIREYYEIRKIMKKDINRNTK